MPLEKIIENLELVVGQFARCDIRDGWRLNLAPPRSVVLHFVLMGNADLLYGSTRHRLAKGTIVMVPPQLAHSLQVGATSGGEVDGDASGLPSGSIAEINLGDSTPEAFVMACGRVEATYGGASGVFDAFQDAVIVDLSDEAAVPVLFDAIYAEQVKARVGSGPMVAALMQQCFILMLRRLERDGFRQIESLAALQDPNLGRVVEAIMETPGGAHSVDSLAEMAHMSRSIFCERFRTVFRRTPMDYVREVRLRRAAALLRRTDLGVERIASQVGFSSRTHFSKAFARHFRISPRDFRSAVAIERSATEEASSTVH